MLLFGENGVVLDNLEEAALERELSDKTSQYGLLSCASTVLVAALIWYAIEFQASWFQSPFVGMVLLVTIGLTMLPCAMAFAGNAVREGYLPDRLGGEPAHKHVGLGTSMLAIAIIFGVLFIARLFEENIDRLAITDGIGLLVVTIIGLAFLSLIFVPHILRSPPTQSLIQSASLGSFYRTDIWKTVTFLPRAIARLASIFDSWMVHAIAPMAGATQSTTLRRYTVLLVQIGATTLLAWNLPSPIGLIAIAWAALIAISVARRWSWTEQDREYALRNPNYDNQKLRVGVNEDLRDEALLALLVMIFLLPLGMRQLHYALGGVFEVPRESASDPIAWISFFGAELAKSIPFVDWVDIYGAENSTRIRQITCPEDAVCDQTTHSKAALSSHIVFGARAVVDLVFLAALIQAISVARRWARHKAMFFNREIDRLDPMLERSEFAKVARRIQDGWEIRDGLRKLEHYNKTRLSSIRLTNGQDTVMWQVATAIMRLRDIPTSSPSEQLIELVSQKHLEQLPILAAIEQAKASDDFDIDTIIYAREKLNGKAAYNQARVDLVEALIGYEVSTDTHPELARTVFGQQRTALQHVLGGETRDSISDVRILAVIFLAGHLWRPDVRQALERAAETDRAIKVRVAAKNALISFDQDPIADLANARQLEHV